jgi:hypothetical protein
LRHHGALRVTFNSGAVLSAIALISRPIIEHRREDARARVRREGVVFALRNASTNDTSFRAGRFRRRRDATIIAERNKWHLRD